MKIEKEKSKKVGKFFDRKAHREEEGGRAKKEKTKQKKSCPSVDSLSGRGEFEKVIPEFSKEQGGRANLVFTEIEEKFCRGQIFIPMPSRVLFSFID